MFEARECHALNYMVFHISQFQINEFSLSRQADVEKCLWMWFPFKCFDQQEKGGISILWCPIVALVQLSFSCTFCMFSWVMFVLGCVCGSVVICMVIPQVHICWRRFKTQQDRKVQGSGLQWQAWSMVYLWHWLGSQSLHGACPRC